MKADVIAITGNRVIIIREKLQPLVKPKTLPERDIAKDIIICPVFSPTAF